MRWMLVLYIQGAVHTGVITVPADDLAPNGARPSAGTGVWPIGASTNRSMLDHQQSQR